MRLATLLLVVAAGCSTPLPPTQVRAPDGELYLEPPAPQIEKTIERPGYVFTHGHWDWNDNQWQWISGRWVPARAGFVWLDGHWDHHGNAWKWVDGKWTAGEAPPASP